MAKWGPQAAGLRRAGAGAWGRGEERRTSLERFSFLSVCTRFTPAKRQTTTKTKKTRNRTRNRKKKITAELACSGLPRVHSQGSPSSLREAGGAAALPPTCRQWGLPPPPTPPPALPGDCQPVLTCARVCRLCRRAAAPPPSINHAGSAGPHCGMPGRGDAFRFSRNPASRAHLLLCPQCVAPHLCP